MAYYYICDICGRVEERQFTSGLILCPGITHGDYRPSMRLVTKEEKDAYLESEIKSHKVKPTDVLTSFGVLVACLAGVCFSIVSLLVMIKFVMIVWDWVF